MSNITDLIEDRLRATFEALGYDSKLAAVKKSDRPDLVRIPTIVASYSEINVASESN